MMVERNSKNKEIALKCRRGLTSYHAKQLQVKGIEVHLVSLQVHLSVVDQFRRNYFIAWI